MVDIQIPTRENPLEEVPPRPPRPIIPWAVAGLLACGAGAGGFLATQRLEAAAAEAASLRDERDEARRRLEDTTREKEGLTRQVSSLTAEKETLAEEVEKKEEELARLKATYDSLQEKMQAEISKGDIKLSESGGRIQVELVDKVLFDSGSAELSSRGEEVLTRLGAVLSRIEDRQLHVSGHTDDSPPTDKIKDRFPTNWELSAARAVNVVRFLAEKAEVPSRRMVAAGYGEFQPVATNANPSGRARNRRIEILLTPVLERVGKQVAAAPTRRKR